MAKVVITRIENRKTNNRYDVKINGVFYRSLESKIKTPFKEGESAIVVFPDDNPTTPYIQGKTNSKFPAPATHSF